MASSNVVQRRDIQGLRGVAVALVVLNHLIAVPAGGFVGVDLFFVISGFVITTMLWRDISQRRFSLRRFFSRRVRRLLPSAVLTLAVVNLTVGSLFLGPRIQQTHEDSLWAMAFLANVHMADAGANYFAHSNAPSLLQHFWSLAVEEQFYAVWPLLLLALVWISRRRHRDRIVLPLVLTLTGASFVYALHAVAVQPESAYFSTPARAWELGVGASIGLLARGLAPPDWLRGLFAWVGVSLLAVACIVIDPTRPFPGMAALVPVGAGALLLLAGGGARPPIVTRALSGSVLQYIGSISYPIYLWHWPVIVIAEEVWGRSALVIVIAPAVSVALAVLTHHLVEEPLRGRMPIREAYRALQAALRGRGPQPYAPVMTPALAILACIVALATVVTVQNPATISRPSSAVVASSLASSQVAIGATDLPAQRALTAEILGSLDARSWNHLAPSLDQLKDSGAPELYKDGCISLLVGNEKRLSVGNEKQCVYGSASAKHQAVILGDSMSVSYVPALRALLAPRGWAIHILAMGICNNAVPVMLGGRPYSACDEHRLWAIHRIQQLRPELVILSNLTNIDWIVSSKLMGTPLETWQRGLTRTLRMIRTYASTMIVMSPPPGGKSLESCVTRFSIPNDCIQAVSKSWDRMRAAEESAAAATGARYINTAAWYCYYGACPAVVGHTPVFVDGIHTTAAYCHLLESVMAEKLLPLIYPARHGTGSPRPASSSSAIASRPIAS